MMSDPSFTDHDHGACVADALSAAERTCAARKLRFTPVRRRALEILLGEHRAMAAYDLLDRLKADGLGSQPPAVYRALDFLTSHGFAHRIEKLNAYVACAHPGADHTAAFMICRSCAKVAEAAAPAGNGRFDQVARDADFQIENLVMEAEGLCPACRKEPPHGAD